MPAKLILMQSSSCNVELTMISLSASSQKGSKLLRAL
jgi:hypothetical protein